MADKIPVKGVFDGNGFAVGLAEFTSSDTLSWTLTKQPIISTPAYQASLSTSVAGVDVVRITLTGNITLGFTGGVDGQKFILELIQDGSGNRSVTYDTSVRFGSDITATVLSTAANKIDRIGVIYNATANKYDVIAFAKGY